MADDIYDLRPQLLYGGAWQDVPLHDDRSVSIVRGRVDEFAEPTHSTFAVVADNRTLDYHPRNPASPLYGLVGRNTPVRAVLSVAEDSFARTVADGWGVADSGHTWTHLGSASAFRVDGKGWHLHTAINTGRHSLIDVGSGDHVFQFATAAPVMATGMPLTAYAISRVNPGAPTADLYQVRIAWLTDGRVTCTIRKRVAGIPDSKVNVVLPDLYSPGQYFWVKMQTRGATVRGSVWPVGTPEPEWLTEWEDPDPLPSSWTTLGVTTLTEPGSTNVHPIEFPIDDVSVLDVRGCGEVAQWSPDRTGDFDLAAGRGDAWCEIAGAGILRRLGQGTPPTQSALFRTILDAGPVAYWPLEDGFASSLAASPIRDCPPAQVLFAPGDEAKMGSNDSLVGSRSLPTLPTSSGIIIGTLPAYADTGQWVCNFFVFVSQASLDIDLGIASSMETPLFTVQPAEAGLIDKWQMRLFYQKSPFAATVYLHAFQGINEILPSLSVIPVDMPLDKWVFVNIQVSDGGSYQTWQFSLTTADGAGIGHANVVAATAGPAARWASGYSSSFGHVAFFDNISIAYLTEANAAMAGWPGETVVERLTRLCAEQGVPLSVVGDAPAPIGPQWPDTFANWLAEVERTDGGLLFEPRDQLGLAYRARASLYAQEPKLILDWAQGQVANPFQPTLDDQATRNDITATRRNGSSARAVLDTGPMSTLPPPDGVGRVETEIQVNPATDDMLPGLASWYLHLGTVEDVRWPRVTVDLDASPELAVAASAVDIGDLIRIVNTPLDVSPDDIDLIVLGYQETIEPRRRRIVFNCRPASPWRVGRWGAFRWDSATSTLDTAVDATQTSLPVAVADGVWWTTDPASTPFDIAAGGERMTVTAVATPAAGVQTMTVTRSVNGVAKPHVTGTPVRLWMPHRWAL